MARNRFVPKLQEDVPGTPFGSAEEAWFWFMRCHNLRRSGARMARGESTIRRPCDPDDIYRIAAGLARQGSLGRQHLNVLNEFGSLGYPPDGRIHEERPALGCWQQAMDRMAIVLRGKGLIV